MIVKEIIKICKREKSFVFYNRVKHNELGEEKITQQFLGTYNSAYLLPGGVSFDEDTVCAAFDIDFGGENDITFQTQLLVDNGGDFDNAFADTDAADKDLDRSPLTLDVGGRMLFPVYEREPECYELEGGFKAPPLYKNTICFVENELMRPIAKEKEIELKLRGDWIVVKQGLVMLAQVRCSELTELEEEEISRCSDGFTHRYGSYIVRKEREKQLAAQSKADGNADSRYKTCPNCGANLDAGETCECQKLDADATEAADSQPADDTDTDAAA